MNKKGQALIEFIIILPIFIMMMLAVFDCVRIYSEKSKLESIIEDVILDDSTYSDVNVTKNRVNSHQLVSFLLVKLKYMLNQAVRS